MSQSIQTTEVIPVLRPFLPTAERILPYLRRINETRLYSNHGPLSGEFEFRLGEHLKLPAEGVVAASSGKSALIGSVLATAGRATAARPLAAIPTFTFVATALAVEQCGYIPYLVDINAETWMLDPDRILEHREKNRIGVVVPVAPFGRPVSQASWQRFRSMTGIPVVIDGAASFAGLADDADRFLGEIPVSLSFHATKAFGIGEGGAVAGSDCALMRRIAHALNFGVRHERDHHIASTNGKLSEYHAAVGLAEFDGWAEKRAALNDVAAQYRQAMMEVGLAERFLGAPDVGPNYALFQCGDIAEAKRIQESLTQNNIEFRLWYGGGIQQHTYYAGASHDDLTTTQSNAPCLLGLPVAPDLNAADLRRVVRAVAAAAEVAPKPPSTLYEFDGLGKKGVN